MQQARIACCVESIHEEAPIASGEQVQANEANHRSFEKLVDLVTQLNASFSTAGILLEADISPSSMGIIAEIYNPSAKDVKVTLRGQLLKNQLTVLEDAIKPIKNNLEEWRKLSFHKTDSIKVGHEELVFFSAYDF